MKTFIVEFSSDEIANLEDILRDYEEELRHRAISLELGTPDDEGMLKSADQVAALRAKVNQAAG